MGGKGRTMGHVHHAALLFIAMHVHTQLKAQTKVLKLGAAMLLDQNDARYLIAMVMRS